MVEDDTIDQVLRQANGPTVTKEDLLKVAAEVDLLDPDSRDYEGHLFTVGRLFRGDFRKATAVMFRFGALVSIVIDKAAHGWALLELPDGSIPTDEAVFAAAAVEPLIVGGNGLTFEKDSFLQRVLEFADLEVAG